MVVMIGGVYALVFWQMPGVPSQGHCILAPTPTPPARQITRAVSESGRTTRLGYGGGRRRGGRGPGRASEKLKKTQHRGVNDARSTMKSGAGAAPSAHPNATPFTDTYLAHQHALEQAGGRMAG
jgi:hypothetical protein